MNFRRLGILIVKERKQLLRDRSSVIMGILLPVFLLLVKQLQDAGVIRLWK